MPTGCWMFTIILCELEAIPEHSSPKCLLDVHLQVHIMCVHVFTSHNMHCPCVYLDEISPE